MGGSSITVVASSTTGIESALTQLTGQCASGWTTCAADLGGGCCASGYACGRAACTATVSGSAVGTIGKIVPSEGDSIGDGSQLAFVIGVAVLFGIVV